MEKRNVVEEGRTPAASADISEVVDEGAAQFMKKTGDVKPAEKPQEKADNGKSE